MAARDGRPAEVVAERAVGGGCIHQARLLDLADGRCLFLKADTGVPDDLFEREAEGLRALAAAGPTRDHPASPGGAPRRGPLRVPADPLHGRAGKFVFLLMEAVPTGRGGRGFFARFGRAFAELHRLTRGERYGFEHDNYLGGTPQPNGWSGSWVEFFRERRLAHQLRLAERRGHMDGELTRLGDRLLDRLDRWLEVPDEPACLLHGDLWSGNFLADDQGQPVLIDPAVYYGHREADLAMTRLFGGFDASFYRAYEEAWPLAPAHEDRLPLYQLYHLLNHLNLFGASYRPRCLAILRHYVA